MCNRRKREKRNRKKKNRTYYYLNKSAAGVENAENFDANPFLQKDDEVQMQE